MLIVLLALAARLVPGPRTIDDAFITFRYARNILAGNGLVFNPGEHVLGTTTPFYAFLLTVLGLFTGGVSAPFPLIALLINALADSLTCLLLLHLGKRLGSTRAGLGAALVWSIAPFSVTFAIGGLETSLYVLLLTAAVAAHLEKRHALTALLGALALLTRPDALILLAPLALDRVIQLVGPIRVPALGLSAFHALSIPARQRPDERSPKAFWREIATFSLPILVWASVSTAYYGSPIPNSIAAKSLAYRLPGNTAFIRLLQHFATPFLGNLTFGVTWIAVGFVLFPFLFLIGARQATRQAPHSWPWLAYPWLYFAAFALAHPLIFRWYLTPPLPAYILVILLGADRLLSDLFSVRDKQTNRRRFRRSFTPALLFAIVIASPVLLNLRGWELHPDHGLVRPSPEMAWYKLELLYRQAADSLASDIKAYVDQHGGELPVLAAGDVGVLGYYTPARILDTVGLNSPESLHYYPLDPSDYVINYAIPPDLIMDRQPDFIVILEVYGRLGLLRNPRFHESYHLRQKIPTDIYGSDGMLIFERNSN
jgi:hypothetical protein